MEFSYRGETLRPSASVDLDSLMAAGGELGDLHDLLARLCGIDTYSYQYEVMEAHEIQFSNATGIAADCLHDGKFDIQRFTQLWQEARELDALQAIAREHLQVDNLNDNEGLKLALLAAYRLGKVHTD